MTVTALAEVCFLGLQAQVAQVIWSPAQQEVLQSVHQVVRLHHIMDGKQMW